MVNLIGTVQRPRDQCVGADARFFAAYAEADEATVRRARPGPEQFLTI
jgi:hypothetical protein